MKVIFLDIDGVLNSKNGKTFKDKFCFDFDLVSNLKILFDTVKDLKIVVSSSWRTLKYDEQQDENIPWRCILANKLGYEIYTDLFIGDTPYRLSDKDKNNRRGLEIKAWLDENKDKYNIEKYVIIDDEICDITPVFKRNVIKVDSNVGLQKTDVSKIISMFNS